MAPPEAPPPFPQHRPDPADAGWDVEGLARFVDWCEEAGTEQLLILHRGEVVVEQYWRGAGPHAARDVFSIQKSVTSVVIGMLVDQGVVDPDRPASTWLGDGWTSTGPKNEAALTLRHLLSMTSGLYDDFSREADPGTVWYYNNNAYHQLARLIEGATGRPRSEVFQQLLFDPLEMADSFWQERPEILDPTGRPLSGLFSTARDLTRFARHVLSGAPLVSEATRASQDLNPSYGLLWWIHDGPRAMVPDLDFVDHRLKAFGNRPVDRRLAPSAPPGTVGAMGAGDQRLFLVPELDLAVVRLGRPVDRATAAAGNIDEALWRRLSPALPGATAATAGHDR